MYAMAHIAIHDALNAIQRRYAPYAYDDIAPPGASIDAAIAAAAHDVMISALSEIPDFLGCMQQGLDQVAADYAAALAAIPDGDAKDDGIALGQAAAETIIGLRIGDGSDTEFLDFSYQEGTTPGEYRFTHGQPFAAAPGWGRVTPFALADANQFLPRPPYPVSCARPGAARTRGSCQLYARDYAEVKAMGGDEATTHGRSADQTQIARSWLESSPLSWNRMGRDAVSDAQFDAWENARLFALLNMGLADGYIASMNTKYYCAFWRPASAIYLAGDDGNPRTVPDETWQPLDPTPPIPNYDSAHAAEGAVAAEVFRRVFQPDHASISVCSLTLPNPAEHCGGPSEVRRTFQRCSNAARENGRKIGAETVRKHLRPQ